MTPQRHHYPYNQSRQYHHSMLTENRGAFQQTVARNVVVEDRHHGLPSLRDKRPPTSCSSISLPGLAGPALRSWDRRPPGSWSSITLPSITGPVTSESERYGGTGVSDGDGKPILNPPLTLFAKGVPFRESLREKFRGAETWEDGEGSKPLTSCNNAALPRRYLRGSGLGAGS